MGRIFNIHKNIFKLFQFFFKGCIADNRYHGHYLDRRIETPRASLNTEQENGAEFRYVKVYRENVYKNCTCDTAGAAGMCLNGGVCMAGSPPSCLCYFGWSGMYCGVKPGDAPLGKNIQYFHKFNILFCFLEIISILFFFPDDLTELITLSSHR